MSDARVLKPRFASIPDWVVHHPEVVEHPAALVVYAHLCTLGDFKTRVTTSDWREIVASTGYSKATVMRAMKVLRSAEVVVRQEEDLRLPMDPPGLNYETGLSQYRDQTVSNLTIAPLSSENSELPHKRRRTKVDPNFTPDAGLLQWAGANHPSVIPERETPAFVDHHLARETLMVDWRAAWRTWIRNAEKFGASKRNGHTPDPDENAWMDRTRRMP